MSKAILILILSLSVLLQLSKAEDAASIFTIEEEVSKEITFQLFNSQLGIWTNEKNNDGIRFNVYFTGGEMMKESYIRYDIFRDRFTCSNEMTFLHSFHSDLEMCLKSMIILSNPSIRNIDEYSLVYDTEYLEFEQLHPNLSCEIKNLLLISRGEWFYITPCPKNQQ